MTPQEMGCDCANCPFAVNGLPSHPVFPTTPLTHEGVLIGECPGAEETRHGQPFIGSTGMRLTRELESARLKRDNFQILNATLCQPPPGTKVAQSMMKAVKACSPYFTRYVDLGAPAFVMGAGAWMAYRLALGLPARLPKGQVSDGRGFVREGRPGVRFTVAMHPTYVFFRNPNELGNWRIDLERYRRILDNALEPMPELFTNGNAVNFIKASNERELGCDVEAAPSDSSRPWTAKDPTRALLKTFGFGTYNWGASFFYPSDIDINEKIKDVITIWQNGPWYDFRLIKRYGININTYVDIRDVRRAMSSNSWLSLRYMASIYLDVPPWKETDEDDKVHETPDPQELMLYNAMDACVTYRIKVKMFREIEQLDFKEQHRIYKLIKLNRQLSVIAAKMHTNGFMVHQENRVKLDKELLEEYNTREKRWQDITGNNTLECSPNNMRRLIYKSCETDDVKLFSLPDPIDTEAYTENDAIKVDKAALLALYTAPMTPDALRSLIVAYWQAEAVWKARSSFVVSEKITQAIGDDGRLRASWNSLGTDTGRFSCSEPNLLTLSEEKD